MATNTLNRSPSCAPQQTHQEATTSKSTRILVVEDEPLTAQVFAQALTRDGHVVDVARDGLQALRHLSQKTPSLIVLDMSLPAVSGAAVVRELRAAGHHDLPIVIVSGSAMAQCSLTQDELRPGMWLTKPIKPRQLVAIVREWLGDADQA